METFVSVADEASFTAAAEQLGLTRAAVSKQIQQLEDHLGVRLLNRTTRRVSLTDIGRAYYDRAQRILAEMEETEQAVSALNDTPRGTLSLNAPMSFGTMHLAGAVSDFMTLYPDLTIRLNLNDRTVDLIEEGYDLSLRIGHLADSSLIARRISTTHLWLCASADYLARHGHPETPDDLKRHRCLHYGYLSTGMQWPLQGPDGEISVPIRPALCANNGQALAAAAVAGQGIVLSPSFIVGSDLQAGRLERILPDYCPPALPVSMIYPPTRYLSAKVRLFIDFLAERFGPLPYWELVD